MPTCIFAVRAYTCILAVDEIDAIGTKRFDSDKAGDREVQRTMLELLNQVRARASQIATLPCAIVCIRTNCSIFVFSCCVFSMCTDYYILNAQCGKLTLIGSFDSRGVTRDHA